MTEAFLEALFDELFPICRSITGEGLRRSLAIFQRHMPLDERQYCSPGFNLPVGQIARTTYGEYDGYHNSHDTKEFMRISTLVHSIDEIEVILQSMELGSRYVNQKPFGEPQLGPGGLYPNLNNPKTRTRSNDVVIDARQFLNRLLTVLSYSDGDHDMMEIASRCGCKLSGLSEVVEKLEKAGLLAHQGP